MQGLGGALGAGVLENMQVPNTTIVTKRPVSSLAYFIPANETGRTKRGLSVALQLGKWLKLVEPSRRLRALHPAT
jgi:hypothetical protein